jgi:hypothetical protein
VVAVLIAVEGLMCKNSGYKLYTVPSLHVFQDWEINTLYIIH